MNGEIFPGWDIIPRLQSDSVNGLIDGRLGIAVESGDIERHLQSEGRLCNVHIAREDKTVGGCNVGKCD